MPTHIFTDEEKENLREQMLEAGFPLLKQYGMTHTSVAKITQAAGIAVGTFYSFWKNKETYMADLIGYHRRKLMPVLIGEDALTGKKKLGREDARRYLYAVIDEKISTYPQAKLFSGTKAFVPDLEKESAITAGLLSYLEHVRADVNPGLVANLWKVLIITVESRAELHEAAYEETLRVQIETILDLIFEA